MAKLLGDKMYLLRFALKAERNGMGVGAMAYYRRIVDLKWQKILHEMEKTARLENATDAISAIAEARKQKQFKNAVDLVKAGLPPSLLLFGHNPVQVLYQATSAALHAQSEAECLARAVRVRVTLYELARRIQSLRDDAQVQKDAILALASIKHQKGS